MSILIFLLKTVLISGLLCVYYWLFLRNRSFSRYNRLFLLAIPFFSFLIPALQFKLPDFAYLNSTAGPIRLLAVANGSLEEVAAAYAGQASWKNLTWESISLIAGLSLSLFFLSGLCRSIFTLCRLRRNKPFMRIESARLYFVHAPGTPFSFFSHIFWDPDQGLNDGNNAQILKHELYHVHNRHSLDILMLEIVRLLCWFNPFLLLIRREIQVVHEFLADAHASAETDVLDYAKLLILKNHPGSAPITHSFFQNPLKRRITMITNHRTKKPGLLGRLMILPVALLLTGLLAFRHQGHSISRLIPARAIRVVVDAGHCSAFPGVIVNGVAEKDLNLQIARKIRKLANDYNIEVIMTRDDDGAAGRSASLKADLEFRAALAGKENADLFVSIHTNADAPDEKSQPSGFEIYIPDSSSKFFSGSVKLGSGISEFIGRDYAVASELKQPEKHVLVLNRATVPAVLIECGNLSDKSDRDFIMNEANQDKIAADILKGIRKYGINQ